MKMNCRLWDDLYDAWREGTLAPEEAEACRLHADNCKRCGELAKLLSDVGVDDAPDLSEEILERTSGSACDRALALLAGRFDAEPDEQRAVLLEAHLDHCRDCAELAKVFAWVATTLPELAVEEPDHALAFDVLRATSAARARRRSGAMGRWRERMGAWWGEQVRRPLFAWEVAFTATVLAVLVFGTPMSPVKGTPERALDVIQAAPAWTSERTGDLMGGVGEIFKDAEASIETFEMRTGPARHDLAQVTKRVGQAVVSADLEEFLKAGSELDNALGAIFAPNKRPSAPEVDHDDDNPQSSGSK